MEGADDAAVDWMDHMLRVVTAFLAVVAIVGVVGCGDDTASSELVDLTTVRPISEAFNAETGAPRLVLLLSPT
jgi:hypothetical protein